VFLVVHQIEELLLQDIRVTLIRDTKTQLYQLKHLQQYTLRLVVALRNNHI